MLSNFKHISFHPRTTQSSVRWGAPALPRNCGAQHLPGSGKVNALPCKLPKLWKGSTKFPRNPAQSTAGVCRTCINRLCLPLGLPAWQRLCRMLSRARLLLMMITIMIITSTTAAVVPRGPQADPCKSKTRSLLWWVDKSGLKQAAATQQGGGLAAPGKLLLQWSKHMPWVLQITVKCSWFLNCWLLPFHFFQSCNHFFALKFH